jgi:hypothetical protein
VAGISSVLEAPSKNPYTPAGSIINHPQGGSVVIDCRIVASGGAAGFVANFDTYLESVDVHADDGGAGVGMTDTYSLEIVGSRVHGNRVGIIYPKTVRRCLLEDNDVAIVEDARTQVEDVTFRRNRIDVQPWTA